MDSEQCTIDRESPPMILYRCRADRESLFMCGHKTGRQSISGCRCSLIGISLWVNDANIYRIDRESLGTCIWT